MKDPKVIRRIRQKYTLLSRAMDPRLRRQWAAIEAMDLGWGGVKTVSLATGLDRHTILAGTRELQQRRTLPKERAPLAVRVPGRGRKRLIQTDPGLRTALEALVQPPTREHPEPTLRWTCQSTAKLAQELQRQNHSVSDRTVAALLRTAGYSLQDRRRCNEGSSPSDRNAQFARINEQTAAFHGQGQPVVWVDTEKKELAGEGNRSGQDWLLQRVPDLASHDGWVNVDVDHDSARFAAMSIGRWWQEMGVRRFPGAAKLLITADVGGSHGSRNQWWKVALQDLANELDLSLTVCHFPPGTTKWHKIDHRLFNFNTQDWRGRPLVSYQVMVNLIAPTAASHGLKVPAAGQFRTDWNYVICPFRERPPIASASVTARS